MPPCAAVTAALSVSIVALAFGRVNVFSEVVGPLNFVNPLPVPPLVEASVPVQPSVRLASLSNDVAGFPPSVSVTLVSSVLVSAPADV